MQLLVFLPIVGASISAGYYIGDEYNNTSAGLFTTFIIFLILFGSSRKT